jgi:hypothetical protein
MDYFHIEALTIMDVVGDGDKTSAPGPISTK